MVSKIMNARNCIPEQCRTCGGALRLGGPIWSDRIHQSEFVNRVYNKAKEDDCKLGTKSRIKGTLGGIIDEELLSTYPLNYDFTKVGSDIKLVSPTKEQIIAGFRSINYILCQTYYSGYLWKTNAPPEVIYEVFKQFKLQKYPEEDVFRNCKEGTLAHKILSKASLELPINFDVAQVDQKIKTENAKRKYFQKPTDA